MIKDTLQGKIQEAMKKGESVRVTALKLLYTSLHNAEIAKIGKLTDDEEMKIIASEIKKRKDAIEIYKTSKEPEKAAPKIKQEEDEMVILMEFMPEQMADSELETIINSVIAELGANGMKDMGRVIGAVMGKVQGKAEGGRVSEMVKTKLI